MAWWGKSSSWVKYTHKFLMHTCPNIWMGEFNVVICTQLYKFVGGANILLKISMLECGIFRRIVYIADFAIQKKSSRNIGKVKKSWSKKAAHESTNIWSNGKCPDSTLYVDLRPGGPTFSHFLEKNVLEWISCSESMTSRSDVIEKMTF